MMETANLFVGAYWPAREETRAQVAARIVRFLSAIGRESDVLARWYSTSASKPVAHARIAVDLEAIARRLRINRRDAAGEPIPELGFALAAWNGDSVSLCGTFGSYSPWLWNAVVLSPDVELTDACWKALLDAAVRAFEPEHAVVTSVDWLDQAGVMHPWEAGWFTYQRGAEIGEHAKEW